LKEKPTQERLCKPVIFAEYKEGDGYCPKCHNTHFGDFIARYAKAIERAGSVEHWSVNYKGRIPVDPSVHTMELESDEMAESRDLALSQLQVTAAFYGYDILINLAFDHRLATYSETAENGRGTHYYNVPHYTARATAGKKIAHNHINR